MALSIRINRLVLESEIERILAEKPRYLLKPAQELAATTLEKVNRSVLGKFDRHPVTKELLGKAEAESTILPFGNLFSFLGFHAQDNPIQNLRQIVKNGIKFANQNQYSYNRRNKVYSFKVTRPSEDEIAEATHGDLPWGTFDSWVNAIEDGISNLSYYLFLSGEALSQSRSGPALQKKKEIHPGADFGGTPYLSEIWEFLEEKLSDTVN